MRVSLNEVHSFERGKTPMSNIVPENTASEPQRDNRKNPTLL